MKNESGIKNHAVVSHEEWLSARTAFLAKEKEFTRLQDELNQERRELPWEAVRKEYVFEGPHGRQRLAELFDGKSQLIVYHFMFEPSATAGCPHCSLRADGFNGIGVHLKQGGVTMIAVSRAPYDKLGGYQKRRAGMKAGADPSGCGGTTNTGASARMEREPFAPRYGGLL